MSPEYSGYDEATAIPNEKSPVADRVAYVIRLHENGTLNEEEARELARKLGLDV